MRIVDPSVKVYFYMIDALNRDGNRMSPVEVIERVARTCYRSEDRIGEGSADKMVRSLRERGHHAMLEFCDALAVITADRGLTHELVRHRLASYAQESTRFCNYGRGKFGGEITVIRQPGLSGQAEEVWREAMKTAERHYLSLIGLGVQPQIARSVLPIGLKTEICIKANLREWRHIFMMRCSPAAHPIIRGVMLEVLSKMNLMIPAVYDDIAEKFLTDEAKCK